MQITKPKDNQILIEDDVLKQFKLKVESHTGLNESGFNEMYQGFILAYRLPDMDASKQIFYGSPISIMTLFCSCMENVVSQGLINEEMLDDMVKAVKENIKNKKEAKYGRRNKKRDN